MESTVARKMRGILEELAVVTEACREGFHGNFFGVKVAGACDVAQGKHGAIPLEKGESARGECGT
jgi:hypothetical protein